MNFLRNIIKGSNRLFGEKTKKIVIVSIALVLIVSYGLFFYFTNHYWKQYQKQPHSTAKTASDRIY
jgi:hypothetical protein